MKRIVAALLALCWACATPVAAPAADPAADKAADIREIMALGEIDDLTRSYGRNMSEQIYQILKTSRPEIPPEAMTIIREEVNGQLAADREMLLEKIAAVFDRSFTAEEVRELKAFYRTELGKKSLALMPAIMQENMEIGKNWGREVGPALKARMEARFKQDKPAGAK